MWQHKLVLAASRSHIKTVNTQGTHTHTHMLLTAFSKAHVGNPQEADPTWSRRMLWDTVICHTDAEREGERGGGGGGGGRAERESFVISCVKKGWSFMVIWLDEKKMRGKDTPHVFMESRLQSVESVVVCVCINWKSHIISQVVSHSQVHQ